MVRINIARVFPSNVCILSDLLISENKIPHRIFIKAIGDVGYSYLYCGEYGLACGMIVSFVAASNGSSGIGFPVRNYRNQNQVAAAVRFVSPAVFQCLVLSAYPLVR